MKILYFYQYFSTPNGSWGTRVYEFAKDWVERGHKVTVATSIYAKSDLKAQRFLETQYIDGITVKIINVKINNKQPVWKRIFSFLAYAAISIWYALTITADIVIASSGPITVGIPGLVAKFFRGRKLVFEVRDLWPEGAIELGVIKNKFIKKIAYWFEKTLYKNSELVVGLSPGIKSFIEKNHQHPNVISVTNSANLKLFGTALGMPSGVDFERNKYAIYTGNIGMVNNSYWLYNAAKELKQMDRSDIKIVLVGEGQQREELCELAAKEGTDNFIRLGLMPKHQLVPLVQNAIVSLVPLKGTPVLDTSSPNKFFESLAAGVPIVQNTQGWMKSYLQENHVGYTLHSDNPKELAEILVKFMDNLDDLSQMRVRAKQVAARDFDQHILAKKMLDSLEAVAQ